MIVCVLKKSGLGVALLCIVASLVFVAQSSAESPWWRVTQGTQPENFSASLTKDEVQKLKLVEPVGEQINFEDPENEHGGYFFVGQSAEEIQEAIAIGPFGNGEYGFGQGNVKVTGGPVAMTGTGEVEEVYEVTFTGALADRPMPLLTAYASAKGKVKEGVTELSHGSASGNIVVMVSNLGDTDVNGTSASPVTIADKLPAGLKAIGVEAVARNKYINSNTGGALACSATTVSCSFEESLASYEPIEFIVRVAVEPGAVTGEMNEVSVSGGGAAKLSVRRPVPVGEAPAQFGVQDYELAAEEEGGGSDTQAGSHPFQMTTTVRFNQSSEPAFPPALAKDIRAKLPPGLIGNPVPFAQCTLPEFLHIGDEFNYCPANTAVGVARVEVSLPNATSGNAFSVSVPIFNLTPNYGEPARFGFMPLGVPVYLDTSVRTGEDYGITVDANNIPEEVTFIGSQITIWGVPGDLRHDNARGWACINDNALRSELEGTTLPSSCNPLAESNTPPLLSLPTSCTGPLQSSVEADSWQRPGVFGTVGPNEAMETLDGCNRLPFNPSIKVTPDGSAGSTPTGLTVDEHVSQSSSLDQEGLSESDVKGLSVTLPQGVVLNPSAADGLQACSEEQIGLQANSAPACPDASKIATVKIKTPLLSEPLEGEAYLASQEANPFGSLVAMYIYAENASEGVRVKAAGEVLENPVTGQLTAHFEGDPVFEHDPRYASEEDAQFLPEVPFEDVELHFFGGDRAPLGTPAECGSYTTTGTFTPWSGNDLTESSSTFNIISGPNGSPCHNPLPFTPTLTAGTTSIQAGGFSPFTMTMSRPDGSQNLQAIKLKMPPGLLGTLATVKLCPEAQANAGTCGPQSLIGHTIVSVGMGGDPYTVTGGEVFITEGYEGAPYGLSIVNPAKAGPFNLGKVIVRAKIEVDQLTAVLTITTDDSGPYKIPTILDGIPLQIQHVEVSVDRPGFTFNPTNCSPLAITGGLYSNEGSTSNVSVPFQATNCAVLAFKPKLTAKTNGKTSRAKGASLSVKLTYPAGPYDANIARVKVDLPKQLPSRLTTLQKACTAATFEANPANCPAASIVGHATATTPVMPVPLTGPAYFVSHAGEEFPSLIVVLQGYGATVHLVGTTYIDPKTSITSSTFKSVPDVPVGTFELTLPQGKYSALAATANLCTTKKLAMPTSFVGQNGAEIHTSTPIVPTGCSKHAIKKKGKKSNVKRKAKKK